MRANHNNGLSRGALFSLFMTSYVPLFVIVILKQLYVGWDYLPWGRLYNESFRCLFCHFGLSICLMCLSILGILGTIVLFRNLESNLPNGSTVRVTKINNRNSDAVGYIATYIVPFLSSDFSAWCEWVVFIILMILIYVIYTNSTMILINPLLNIWYSLLEIEYVIVGDSSEEIQDALIIAGIKDIKENINYQVYPIGFKLYYGKEK